MTDPRTKTKLSEKDIEKLKNEVHKLRGYMCAVTEHISTPKIDRGCNMSKDLEDLVGNLIPERDNTKRITDIGAALEDISDIAVGVEVGVEDILIPTRKTKRHFHNARKLIMIPVP